MSLWSIRSQLTVHRETHEARAQTGRKRSYRAIREPYKTDIMAELVPGGDLHDTWKSWLDTLSEFMDDLTFDNGEAIPIVFRIFHEGTENWYVKLPSSPSPSCDDTCGLGLSKPMATVHCKLTWFLTGNS